jgi:hypothetical protein
MRLANMRKLTVAAMLVGMLATTPALAQWHGHGGGGWHGGGGGNLGGAILGGVIGGFIGGAMQPQQPQYYQPQYVPEALEQVAYCSRMFRSYNPETGFYFGFDGRYHHCP